MDPTVEYRDVPGFPSYKVGADGSVWSRWWRGNRDEKCRRIDVPPAYIFGYTYVTLYRADATKRRVGVHLVIMAAFVGPKPVGMEVCHGDGVGTNNALYNLRYDTHSANMHDAALARRMRMAAAQYEFQARDAYTLQDLARSQPCGPALVRRYGLPGTIVGCMLTLHRRTRADRFYIVPPRSDDPAAYEKFCEYARRRYPWVLTAAPAEKYLYRNAGP